MEEIEKWHARSKNRLNLAPLVPSGLGQNFFLNFKISRSKKFFNPRSDAVRLNPVTVILERYAEELYSHPTVKQYVKARISNYKYGLKYLIHNCRLDNFSELI